MPKDHKPSVKDDEQYEKLREKGESKEKAARIANTTRSGAPRRGGKSGSYEQWSNKDLLSDFSRRTYAARDATFPVPDRRREAEIPDALPAACS